MQWCNIFVAKSGEKVNGTLPIAYTEFYSVIKQLILDTNASDSYPALRTICIYKTSLSEYSFYNRTSSNQVYNIITIGF